MPRTVLCIDLGSSYTKVHYVDRDGHFLWSGKRDAPMTFSGPSATQDMTSTLEDVAALVREGPVDGRDVVSVIATGQMGGYVPVDASGTFLEPLDSYLDTRFAAFARDVMASEAMHVWQTSGGNPFVGPKVGRAVTMGQLPAGTVKVINASAVPAMALCGLGAEAAFTDSAQVWLWGMYDVLAKQWDRSLAAAFHVPIGLLPTVLEPWTEVGGISGVWSKRLGLPSGTPVFAGAGDGMVGWFGVGAGEPGTAVDTAGTTSHLGIALDTYRPDVAEQVVACMRGVSPNQWFHQGWATGSGLAYDWIMEHLRDDQAAAVRAVPPGSEGVRVMPYFAGRTSPDQPHQRGAILGLRPHHNRGHLLRATLEAVAFEFAHWIRVSRQLGGGLGPDGVVSVGTGAQNDVWLGIKADVVGVPFLQPPDIDYAARGAAAIAWHALGEGPLSCTPPSPEECVRFEPDPERHTLYETLLDDYLELAERLNDRWE